MAKDRSHLTQDFEFVDLQSVEELEVDIDHTGKVWVNLNGKCLLRVEKVNSLIFRRAELRRLRG